MHICLCIYTCMCVYLHPHVFSHTLTYMYVHIHIYTFMYVQTYRCSYRIPPRGTTRARSYARRCCISHPHSRSSPRTPTATTAHTSQRRGCSCRSSTVPTTAPSAAATSLPTRARRCVWCDNIHTVQLYTYHALQRHDNNAMRPRGSPLPACRI